MQVQSIAGHVIEGSEDCLYLDVRVPPPPPAAQHAPRRASTDGGLLQQSFAAPGPAPLLPVLAFIHGGSFVLGDDSQFGAYAVRSHRLALPSGSPSMILLPLGFPSIILFLFPLSS